MTVTLFLPGAAAQELSEAEVFNLDILSRRLMGLPQLGAAINKVERVLVMREVDTLASSAHYAAYAVANAGDYELAVNPAATSKVEALLERLLDEPLCGPVLVIDAQPQPSGAVLSLF